MLQFHPANPSGLASTVLLLAAFFFSVTAFSSELKISINQGDAFGTVLISDVDSQALAALKKNPPDLKTWHQIFSVKLRTKTSQLNSDDLPNLSGQYKFSESGFNFIPDFPPARGLYYDISVKLQGQALIRESFLLNKKNIAISTPPVINVFPSGKFIPANTLRIYLHFSKAMKRGQVAKNIHLLDEKGDVIKAAFILGPIGELWDSDLRRLTLLLDPGRIKREVAPNRKLGPALVSGQERTLLINAQFEDADGINLNSEFRKTFKISEAIYSAVNTSQWKFNLPGLVSHESLRIQFPYPLDYGMLKHSIRIFDSHGEALSGKVIIGEDEMEWHFIPDKMWENGEYTVKIPVKLEDISGNNILAPMDVDLNKPASKQKLNKSESVLHKFQIH